MKEMGFIMEQKYVIGVDFGSDSVRAVVVDVDDGETIGNGVAYYPRWRKGLYQHPEQAIFRQHPSDYLEALEKCIRDAVSCLNSIQVSNIMGIGVDTTGSTPVPVNKYGIPLALTEEFAECENAMFHLWKDHSAMKEAEEIDKLFSFGSNIDYSKYQGKYSAEWFWAKILHTIRQDEKIKKAAYTWVEHCDWIVGVLCGNTKPEQLYHSACAAGHKALWHSEWNGLPDENLLEKLDPYLVCVKKRYGKAPLPAIERVGYLTPEWAERLGLPNQVSVSGSSFDAHAGAVGAGIKEKTMVCTLGTSAVDMIVAKSATLKGKKIKYLGGQAENSILPGYIGIETGQAAFGDIFAWFKNVMMWPIRNLQPLMEKPEYDRIVGQMESIMLDELQKQAENIPLTSFPIALDWFNGRRYPYTDDSQKAVISDLTLGTDAPAILRALIFGAICGLKRIIEGFEMEGIEISDLVAVGGISKKSNFVMQMMSDVLGKRIAILNAEQTCALGAAIYAAVAADIYPSIDMATEKMAAKRVKEYVPDIEMTNRYTRHYHEYIKLAQLREQKSKQINLEKIYEISRM